MADTKTRVMIENEIKKVFRENNQIFFSYAWREEIN